MQTKQNSHATHIWLHYLPCHQKFCFGLNRQSPGWCTTCWLYYLHYHQQFCFGLNRKLHFCQFTYFIYIFEFEYVWTCFFLYVSSICLFSSQRLSRAIYQYIFSRQTGTQFPDCITCLVNTNFILVFTDNCAFANLLILYFWVWICLNVLFLCFIHLQFSIVVCSHRLSRATTDRHPEG